MRHHDPKKCELCYDVFKVGRKPCHGAVIRVAGVRLCLRHRRILASIVADANQEKARHPVHHRRGVAA